MNSQFEYLGPRLNWPVSHALFDFDGTLSLIREGWDDIMARMMVEVLQQANPALTETDLFNWASAFVSESTGQPTINQMAELTRRMAAEGGRAETPTAYKALYLQRLSAHTQARYHEFTTNPNAARLRYTVPGAYNILKTLQARGVTCYLASGTDHEAVVHEVELLGMTPYFEDRIYGARNDAHFRSKAQVLALMQERHQLKGPEIVVFGDGPLEIAAAAAINAIGVGLATNEATRQGINPHKRTRLIEAGANFIIPDFSQMEALTGYLFELET